MNYQARYNQEQASWIKQGWEEGQVNEYQLWNLANARLDIQHHIRLFLELGFIPCSGFPLVPVYIKKWELDKVTGKMVGRYGKYTAVVWLEDGQWFYGASKAGVGDIMRGGATCAEVGQWRVESFIHDKVTQ